MYDIEPELDFRNNKHLYVLPNTPDEIYEMRLMDKRCRRGVPFINRCCYHIQNYIVMCQAQDQINQTQAEYEYTPLEIATIQYARELIYDTTYSSTTRNDPSNIILHNAKIFLPHKHKKASIPLLIFDDIACIPIAMRVVDLKTCAPVRMLVQPDLYIALPQVITQRYANGVPLWFTNEYGTGYLHDLMLYSHDSAEWNRRQAGYHTDHINGIVLDLSGCNLRRILKNDNLSRTYDGVVDPITGEWLDHDNKNKMLRMDVYRPYIKLL